MNILLTLAAAGIAGYAALAILVYANQSNMLYQPQAELDSSPADANLAYEDVQITTADGVRLHGWYVPGPTANAPVLLFFHGNAGNISHRVHSLVFFHRLGVATLIIDYRGYGRSEGQPSEAGTYADALAAWKYLRENRQVPAERIVVLGRSLGGAVALWLANQVTPAGLIIESSFLSVPAAAAHHYPHLPVRWLSRYQYPNADRITGVRCPVLIVHGRKDVVIPFAHGRELFTRANEPKSFLELNGDHNDAVFVDQDNYRAGLTTFLQTHLK